MNRVPLRASLTPTQEVVTMLVGTGHNYAEIAEVLSISAFTAKRHAEDAAAKIPGDLPTQMKLAVWARGGTLDVLDGSTLRTTLHAQREHSRQSGRVANTAHAARLASFRS